MSFVESYQGSPSEDSCVTLANHLITQCTLNISQLSCINEIDCNVIVSLFESITGHRVPDLLSCEDKVEEGHNVQAVIDTLSLDLLGISLSHITGDAVVGGEVLAIFNLLQVLEGVQLYLSGEKKGNKVIKRKVCQIKRNSPRPLKENCIVNTDVIIEHSSDHSSLNSSKSVDSVTALSTQTKNKRLKPAFSRTRLRSSSRASGSISKQSSMKESSILSHINDLPSATASLSSEQIPSIGKPSLQKEYMDLGMINQDIKTPSFSNGSESISLVDASPAHPMAFQDKALQTEPLKASVIKRKISKFSQPERKVKESITLQKVEELYEENLEFQVKALLEKNISHRSRSLRMKKMHLQTMRKPLRRSPLSPCNKSFLLPHSLRRRSVVFTSLKQTHSKVPPKKIEPIKSVNSASRPPCGFIQDLLTEFPSIQMSPTIMNHIKTKYEQHLLKMHKRVKAYLLKKPKTEIQAEEAAKRQHTISNILKKDMQQQQYLKKVREEKSHENKIKYRLRDARLTSIKMKQYCDEFHEEMKKKMQKQNFTEELIFERAFKEAVNIQRNHVDHLCQQVKEAGEDDANLHFTYLASLENLYQTQFAMISEGLSKEKKDAQTRVNSEKQVLDKMQREFQEALKQEIRFMQRTIVDLTEDCHFRELDAEQYIERVRDKYTR